MKANALIINLINGQIRVAYNTFFGDDMYVMDFDNANDAVDMWALVNMPGLTKWELIDLGFTL